LPTNSLPRLLLVSDRRRAAAGDPASAIGEAAAAGLRFVQVREKDLDEGALERLLERVMAILPEDSRVTVNGRPGLARRFGIGLHLPAASPATRAGFTLLGRSAHDARELDRALAESADYVVFGNVFASASKPGRPGLGLEALADACRRVSPTPVYAIGGLTAAKIPRVREAGAYGVAVVGAILEAPSPKQATERLLQVIGDW